MEIGQGSHTIGADEYCKSISDIVECVDSLRSKPCEEDNARIHQADYLQRYQNSRKTGVAWQ